MASRTLKIYGSWPKPASIGFLGATTPQIWGAFVDAFEAQLAALGWIKGDNLKIDYRWAHGQAKQYDALAAQFVKEGVDIIVTSGTAPVLAAMKATADIPIVFAAAGDPGHTGLSQDNVTGLSNRQPNLAVDRIKLLRQLMPNLKRLAVLGNDSVKNTALEIAQVNGILTPKTGIQVVPCPVHSHSHIASRIKALRGKADALYVCTDPFVTTATVTINTSAAAAGLPTMHAFREYVELGGLASVGPDFRRMFGNAGRLVHALLRGDATPAGLSIQDETATEIVVNRHTATALGVKIPATLKADFV